MTRKIYEPGINPDEYALKIANGGTGGTSLAEAGEAIGLVTNSQVGAPNGVVRLINGKLPDKYMADLLVSNLINIEGPISVYQGTTNTYKITDYDRYKEYSLFAVNGTVSRSGDTITYIAPNVVETGGFVINDRRFSIQSTVVKPVTPEITSPTNGDNNVATALTLVATAFSLGSIVDVHVSSDWQLSSDANFTNILASVTASTTSKVSFTPTGLVGGVTYHARVRYTSANYGSSEWSTGITFTTKAYVIPNHEMAKLIASDKATTDYFGYSVSISNDGARMVIGAYTADPSSISNAGAAYVFVKVAGTWSQEAKLTASNKASDDYFGYSVTISGDGTRIVATSKQADPSGVAAAGAAYVFLRTGTTWTEEAVLLASDKGVNHMFGDSVSICHDGSRIAIGSSNVPAGGNGAVYIYIRSGTVWTQEAELSSTVATNNDQFGFSVSMTGDGTRVAIGAPGSDPSGVSGAGAAYVFLRTGTAWSQESKLVANINIATDNFGYSVSISGDGTRMAIGAATADSGGLVDTGAVYVFVRTGVTWTQEVKLYAGDKGAGDLFGCSVSISGNGDRMVVGAYVSDQIYSDSGAGYIFTRTGTSWVEEAKITQSSGAASDNFGKSISISADGLHIIAGAAGADPAGIVGAGAAYIFE